MYSVFELRGQGYNNMIIEEIKSIVVVTMKDIYKSYNLDLGKASKLKQALETDVHLFMKKAGVKSMQH